MNRPELSGRTLPCESGDSPELKAGGSSGVGSQPPEEPCLVYQSDLDRRDALVREEEDSSLCALSEPLGSVSGYKPRDLQASTQKDVRRTLSKRRRAKGTGEQRYESPEESLAVRASWLKRLQDPLKLSEVAFSITASIVNHHINQHRKQCRVMIPRELLEDLVVAELKVLEVYGYEEWIPGDRPKKRAIVWDDVIDGAIRANLPDPQHMSPDQCARLTEEIDRQIEAEATEANRQREKGLEVRRGKKVRSMQRYVKYLEEYPNATVQMAATDLDLGRSTVESYRRELGLTQQRDIS